MSEKNRHYSASQLAGIQGMPTRAADIPRFAAKHGWPSRARAGRGGGREYPIEALPSETQLALARKIVSSPPGATPGVPGGSEPSAGFFIPTSAPANDARAENLGTLFDAKPESIKAQARYRLSIVQKYFAMRAGGFNRLAVLTAISNETALSIATIGRFLAKLKGESDHLWLYRLCPTYAGRTAQAEISPEAWEVLKGDYLRRERPTAEACIARLKLAAKGRGWIIPSNRTLQRRLKDLPRALAVYAREGASAAQQLYPAQQRDKSALHALQIINGDGYKHNLWVVYPDGEVIRAKTWFWQDVYSSRILGFRTDKTEHTDMIRLSFGDIVENYGIPDKVLLDNTLAAANKTMSGGVKHRFRFKVRDDEPLGVFPLINTKIMWATPGHGQAKPIERTFGIGGIGEMVDKAPEFSGAWTGGNPLDKPDYDGKTRAIPIADLERVIAREVANYNAKTGRRGAIQQGRSFDEVFTESFATAPIRRATEAQRRLWLLATEPVQANSRDGAITLGAGRAPGMANRYWADELVEFAGTKIVARFDPQRLHKGVHVYTCDGRYVCFAKCVEAQGFDNHGAAREHARMRNQFNRGARDQVVAVRRMNALEVAQAYADSAPPMIPAPARGKVVRGEFRDPLEQPRVAIVEETAEEAADRAAFAAEMASNNVKQLRAEEDETTRYCRWLAIDKRITDAVEVADDQRAWHTSYQRSSEWRTCRRLAEDFPKMFQERASA